MQNFISFLMVLIFFEICLGLGLSYIKNVPSRDNCPWQVTPRALSLGSLKILMKKYEAMNVLADNLFEGVKESQRVSFMFGRSVIFA